MEIRPSSSNSNSIILTPQPPPARDIAPVPASGAATSAAPIKLDAAAKPAGVPGKEELAQALNSINAVLQDRSPGLEFSIDSASERAVVKVVDKDTNEVIRQMPSREAMEIAQALDKLHSLLVRDTA